MIWIKSLLKRGWEKRDKNKCEKEPFPNRNKAVFIDDARYRAPLKNAAGNAVSGVFSAAPYCRGQWLHMACASTFGTCICCPADVCIVSLNTRGTSSKADRARQASTLSVNMVVSRCPGGARGCGACRSLPMSYHACSLVHLIETSTNCCDAPHQFACCQGLIWPCGCAVACQLAAGRNRTTLASTAAYFSPLHA